MKTKYIFILLVAFVINGCGTIGRSQAHLEKYAKYIGKDVVFELGVTVVFAKERSQYRHVPYSIVGYGSRFSSGQSETAFDIPPGGTAKVLDVLYFSGFMISGDYLILEYTKKNGEKIIIEKGPILRSFPYPISGSV